ncbi:serine/threonine protein kinase [Rivularia sp. PCC 7116]|uniref:serine/threonine protein kinase n=1 Tax=Rivularia sp. PCC 7116 TaxID=373994 RepID=UPI00029F2084|nr:serine/threonine-protein kinase [Rivularia sp. PCC 7116]AFY56257.1 serine/threonine protein kinase [Rivularia sp. PCC 7116]
MLEANKVLQERYQLKERLAQNAGRQTWLAEDISVQPAETVILKFLSFGEQFQWQDLKLFEREADILKQLSHPKIPKYRDYFSLEDKTNWFALVEEYIPGKSLKQLIESKQRFTEKELRKIAAEVLDILCYLHTLNPQVIHRDIKPSNLIIGEDEKVYLIDFGAVQDNAAAKGATFTVVGTYGYAPIEQFGGRTVPASDLYALGATLIHLATGMIPADLPQIKMRIQFKDKVSLSDGFISWIEKLTQPDIDDRFSSTEEALKALNSRTAVNYSGKISKPQDTRIQINKFDGKLEIRIAAEGSKSELCFFIFILFFTNVLIIIFCSSLIFYIIFTVTSLPFYLAIFFIVLQYCKTLYIRLKPDNFVMEWSRFDSIYKAEFGETSKIKSIKKEYYYYKYSKAPIVMIEAGTQKYSFDLNLDEAEIDWLVEEINDWLYKL